MKITKRVENNETASPRKPSVNVSGRTSRIFIYMKPLNFFSIIAHKSLGFSISVNTKIYNCEEFQKYHEIMSILDIGIFFKNFFRKSFSVLKKFLYQKEM